MFSSRDERRSTTSTWKKPNFTNSFTFETDASLSMPQITARLSEVTLDPTSGSPTGVIGRIALAEPTKQLRDEGISSIDGMYKKIDEALAEAGYSIWALLDRLDVAFAESHDLEANAIRALIWTYNDLRSFDRLSIKVLSP